MSGDEPHYLAVAQSLASDFDLDLHDNYLGDRTRRFGVESLEVDESGRRLMESFRRYAPSSRRFAAVPRRLPSSRR